MVNDPVNHPAHYNSNKYETIDIIEDILQKYPDSISAFLAGNAIKYISRAPHKGNFKEDIAKASWYLNRLASRS